MSGMQSPHMVPQYMMNQHMGSYPAPIYMGPQNGGMMMQDTSSKINIAIMGILGMLGLGLLVYLVVKLWDKPPAKDNKSQGSGNSSAPASGSSSAPAGGKSTTSAPASGSSSTDSTPAGGSASSSGSTSSAIGNVRYVRIQRVTSGSFGAGDYTSINLGEVLVYNKNTPITISGGSVVPQFRDWGWRNVIDGSPSTFAHTTADLNARITLDLGMAQPVDEIVIVNRQDCCQERIIGCELQLLDVGMNVLKKWAFADVKDAPRGAGRYKVGVSTNMVLQSTV